MYCYEKIGHPSLFLWYVRDISVTISATNYHTTYYLLASVLAQARPVLQDQPAESVLIRIVESVEDLSKRFNIRWASIRNAHKRSNDNKPINMGYAHWRTYTEVTTPASEQ